MLSSGLRMVLEAIVQLAKRISITLEHAYRIIPEPNCNESSYVETNT